MKTKKYQICKKIICLMIAFIVTATSVLGDSFVIRVYAHFSSCSGGTFYLQSGDTTYINSGTVSVQSYGSSYEDYSTNGITAIVLDSWQNLDTTLVIEEGAVLNSISFTGQSQSFILRNNINLNSTGISNVQLDNQSVINCNGNIDLASNSSNSGTINCSGNFNYVSLSNTGTIDCNGTLTMNSNLGGTIVANNLIIDSSGNHESATSITVKESLAINIQNYQKTEKVINVSSDTAITTAEGTWINISIDGRDPVEVFGAYTNKPASYFLKSNQVLSISESNVYYGTEFDFPSKIIGIKENANLTYTFIDNDTEEIYDANTVPTKQGEYSVRIQLSETTNYKEYDNNLGFSINYLDFPGTCTITQTPVEDDGDSKFYNTPITLRAPEGYEISLTDGDDSDFTSTITLDEDGYRMGVTGSFRRKDDGAETSPGGWLYTGYFLIDQTPPVILQDTAYDQDGVAISTEIKDGVTLNARTVTFEVNDTVPEFGPTLNSVTVDGNDVHIDSDFGIAEVTLKRLIPGKETHKIIAKDDLGNTSTWNITLKYLPTATPETPFTISGSEGKNGYYTSDITLTPATGYKISADVNGTFTDTLLYKSDMENVYLMDSAGLYTDPIPVSFQIDKTKPQFTVGSDENGNSFEITDGLEVHAKKLSFSVSDTNLTAVTVNGEAVDIANGAALIELAPEAGKSGNYEIYAEDIAGNSKSATVSIEYLKDVATATVSLGDDFIGVNLVPALVTNSNGTPEYYYKKVGASDDTYSKELPNAIGEYQVQVRIPATESFTAVSAEDTFKLSYLTAPETAFTVSGTPGKNDFYTTDVELVAPKGFKISDSADGKYKTSITYKEGMDKIYLMRDDGALTGAIAFNEKYKIDKLSPEPSLKGTSTNNKTLKTKLIDIKNGLSVYADTLDFTIFDENLMTITINGETVDFNEKTAKISLDANNTTSKFNIVAEDKAGNTASLSVVLKATWLENNIIPAGAKITLEAGQVYNLEGGKWTVSGDSTVYYGGNSFCVDGTKDCVFSEAK